MCEDSHVLTFYLLRFKENTTIPKEIASLVKRHPSAVTDIPEAVNVSTGILFTVLYFSLFYSIFIQKPILTEFRQS